MEAVIALSIVFVAGEIVHSRQGRPGLAQRLPALVAFTFGLLHGFGFAGALSEIGLPQQQIPLALFTFNVGVEIGQLLFVGAVLLLGPARPRPAPPGAGLVAPGRGLRHRLGGHVLGVRAGGCILTSGPGRSIPAK